MPRASRHWESLKGDYVERQDVANFLEDIKVVYQKHNMSISHEDGHGAFIIVPYSRDNFDWLKECHIAGLPEETEHG